MVTRPTAATKATKATKASGAPTKTSAAKVARKPAGKTTRGGAKTVDTPAKAAPRRPPKPAARTVAGSVDALLATLELDEAGKAKAAIGRALASKLDEAALSDSGAVAMATAGIARELREVLDAILEETADDGEFVADLFTP